MTRFAVIAAMPAELEPSVAGWRRESRDGIRIWTRALGSGTCVAACAGMGGAAAARAWAEIERDGPIGAVLSLGWAGALRPDYLAGQAYGVAGVVDAQTGERFRSEGPAADGWLVTTTVAANAAEKRRLADAFRAVLVDMEAAAVARLAAARDVPFYCLKGVSDGPSERLPDFGRFLSSEGQFQRARFLSFAAIRPWIWPTLSRLGRNSRRAAREFRQPLHDILRG